MKTFSRILRHEARFDANVLRAHVPDEWMQGRSAFGGLQSALALVAMRKVGAKGPLRTLQTTFLAPVAGDVAVQASILRTGKSATHVEAKLVANGAVLALFVGVFGEPRASVVAGEPTMPPRATTSAGIPFPFVPGLTPNFIQHFDATLLEGAFPFTGGKGAECVYSVGMKDEGPLTEEHVVALSDFTPPLALNHLTTPAPGSTLTWMLEVFPFAPGSLPLAGHRIDSRLFQARDGYTSQSDMIWGPGGEPLALGHQCMAIFG